MLEYLNQHQGHIDRSDLVSTDSALSVAYTVLTCNNPCSL